MKIYRTALCVIISSLIVGCSTTKSIPEGDRLYIGMKKIEYISPQKGKHFYATQEELNAALAAAPNGSLFGSSIIKSPFPIGLWIWNEFVGSDNPLDKWLLKSFGAKPVLISSVNPDLRASVGREVLHAHGYFRGNVSPEVIPQKNPKKAKVGYKISAGHLFTVDTLSYENFSYDEQLLLDSTKDDRLVKPGAPFDVSTLESERSRITKLFRANGFYFYQPSYASYLADTLVAPGKVRLKFQQRNGIPELAKRKWHLGRIDIELRKQFMEQLNDTIARRRHAVSFNGRHTPVRTSVIFNALKMRPGQLYNYIDHEESFMRLNNTGIFSMVEFNFTPRDTTGVNDTLDVRLNCLLDKPYDFYIKANMTGKTNNCFGPGAVVGLAKRNAFHGGELFDINLRGNYEWQTNSQEGSSTGFNSYAYGFDISLQFPRLVIPLVDTFRQRSYRRFRRNRYVSSPTTMVKLSLDAINRSNYFNRHVVSGEWTYNIQQSATSRHQISPFIFSYEFMRSSTAAFDTIMKANPYLYYTMRDQFVPKMQYVYTYTSPASYRSPIWFQATVSEAGNILSLANMIGGKKWNEKNKQLFLNPYAQFVKFETEFVKTWRLDEHGSLVAHIDAGAIWSYGNSSGAPYSEQFYVGGANSIRAYTVRFVGPGSYHNEESKNISYLDQTGDIRILANLEYRPRLFGNLYGALFLDAGNVWETRDTGRKGAKFKLKDVPKDLAFGTGVGLRYDLDFMVIRLDWGLGLHVPYRPGFYNVGAFKDSQSVHLAVGYPF